MKPKHRTFSRLSKSFFFVFLLRWVTQHTSHTTLVIVCSMLVAHIRKTQRKVFARDDDTPRDNTASSHAPSTSPPRRTITKAHCLFSAHSVANFCRTERTLFLRKIFLQYLSIFFEYPSAHFFPKERDEKDSDGGPEPLGAEG